MAVTTQIERKSFTYRTGSEWIGRRTAGLESRGKPSLRISSPPEFRGEVNVWTPEDLFVASLETCFLMTFAGLIERRHLAVEAYYSMSEGLLEYGDDGYRFTKVTIRPTVIVTNMTVVPPVMEALSDAKRTCLIARSVNTEIVLEPDVEASVTE
jgi:organic hydroperoxide reductase OsmC/OhrA